MPTALYTMFGGVQAVTWTDVKQMGVIVAGVLAAVVVLVLGLPTDVSARRGAAPRRRRPAGCSTIDFSLRPDRARTRSGPALIGGLFLMLSYFGCDQSQVQRYLTAKSVDEGARVAADERVREDPAAGADPADRRAGLRVLPVHPAADAVQPATRRAAADEGPRPREYRGARAASSIARSTRGGTRRSRRPERCARACSERASDAEAAFRDGRCTP